MSKRIIGIITILTIIISLVGCSGSNTNNEVVDKKLSEKEEAVTIEFFQGKVEAVDTFDKLIEKFEKENPNIKVNQVNVPDYDKVLATRVAIDDIPDIFNCYITKPEFKVLTEEGYVMDLTDKSFLSNINQGILDTAKSSDKVFALPLTLNTYGIYYNTDIFKDYSIDIPKTWDELIDVAKKLQSKGITPFALTDKESWTISQQGKMLEGMLIKDKEDFYMNMALGNTKPSDDIYATIGHKLLQLREYCQGETLATDYAQGISSFANSEAAMFINGIWTIPSIKKANPDLNFEMFPIPANSKEEQTVLAGVDLALAISDKTKYQQEALKFFEFLTKTENAQIIADLDGSPSAVNGVNSKAQHYKVIMKYINEGKVFGWTSIYYPLSVNSEHASIYQNLIVNKEIEQFLEDFDKTYKDSRE